MTHPPVSKPVFQTPTIHPKYDGLSYVVTPSGDIVLIIHRWIENDTPHYLVRLEDENDSANDLETIAVESELSPLPEIDCLGCGFTHTNENEFSQETGNCWACTFKAAGYSLRRWKLNAEQSQYGWRASMYYQQRNFDNQLVHSIYESGGGDTRREAVLNAYHFAYETLMDDIANDILV